MKISIAAPAFIPIPPPMYGGIELVVYDIIQGLNDTDNEVILFAPKDSKVPCALYPYLTHEYYFGIDSPLREKVFVAELSAKYAYAMSAYEKCDLIHDHTLSGTRVQIPALHTLHGPANDLAVGKCVELSENPLNNFVAISDRQKELYLDINKNINFIGTVHNSVDVNNIDWTADKEDFFLFIGRCNWEKGLDLAVRVASKAKIGLVMAVKMSEDFEKEFFRQEIKPWIDKFPSDLHFELHEEISPDFKFNLYKRAKCTLFTSQWEEPFGLVMIESMASGTPVIALNRGAAPEVIVDGKTGFLVNSEEEMIEATKNIDSLKSEDCRKHVENNFSRELMTAKYLEMYRKTAQSA